MGTNIKHTYAVKLSLEIQIFFNIFIDMNTHL